MSDVGSVISQEVMKYALGLKAGKIKSGQTFWPDLQPYDIFFFDKNITGREHCEATRARISGVLTDEEGLKAYLSSLSNKEKASKGISEVGDIDGDAKPDTVESYMLSAGMPPPMLESGPFCFINDWIVGYSYQPLLSVVRFSGGGNAVISSMIFSVRADALTLPLLP